MKPRSFFLAFLSLLLVFSVACAADPPTLVDPAFLTPYLPNHTLLYGVDEDDTLYLLMQNPSGNTVFVGGTRSEAGEWSFTESTPLPADTRLGVENFYRELGIRTGDGLLIVTLAPLGDTWGVRLVDNAAYIDPVRMGSMWISLSQPLRGVIGDHPWSDITTIDWMSLPTTYEKAVSQVNFNRWALVKHEGAQLLRRPDAASGNIGQYYCGAPVCLKEFQGDYARVQIGNTEGWMRIEHLAMNVEISSVNQMEDAYVAENTVLYAEPDENAAMHTIDDSRFIYILGSSSGSWAHVWVTATDEYGYIMQEEVSYGDG